MVGHQARLFEYLAISGEADDRFRNMFGSDRDKIRLGADLDPAPISDALGSGADLIGGCLYTDIDPTAHVRRIFALARKHYVDVDFHLDFSLDPEKADLPAVIERRGRMVIPVL